MTKGAELSPCGKYRYKLWRIWDDSKPKVLFIMLNPSTADADHDDPTIRRCIRFAQDWGYGGMYVGNAFAFRSTDPKALKKVDDPIGAGNMVYLKEMNEECEATVCAWGIPPITPEGLIFKLHTSFKNVHHLGKTKDGHPRHPLYLPANTQPVKLTNHDNN